MKRSYLKVEKFQDFLKSHNLSQSEFAKKAGMTRGHLNLIINKQISVGTKIKGLILKGINRKTGKKETYLDWFK